MPDFKPLDNTHKIHEAVMPLFSAGPDNQFQPAGTAFVIAPGWALTAYHVVEDFFRFHGQSVPLDGRVAAAFRVLGYLTFDEGKNALPVEIMAVWNSSPGDICVLAFGTGDLPLDHHWTVLTLDLLPPMVGATVVGFGFANQDISHVPDKEVPTYRASPRETTGKVIEIHHLQRDSVRLPFPCFRTDARFDGGMSGGPLFNTESGAVCGVICSSIPAVTDHDEHISYASTLWPVAGTMVDAGETVPSGAIPYPLYDLMAKGRFSVNGLERVRFVEESNGLRRVAAIYPDFQWDNPGWTQIDVKLG